MQLHLITSYMLLLCAIPVWSQSEKALQTLERIQSYYHSAQECEYEVMITYFEDYTATSPASQVKMRVQQNAASSYRKIESRTETLEQFFGHGIGLEVDHNQQTVRYDRVSSQIPAQAPVLQTIVEMAQLPGMQLDMVGNNGLRLHAPGKSNTQIDLEYDPVHHRLLEVSMLIDVNNGPHHIGLNGSKMICTFDYLERSAPKQLSDFLVGDANAYQLARPYQSFTLFR